MLNFKRIILSVFLVLSGIVCSYAGEIVLTIESPNAAVPVSGIANLRGWAVSSVGIERIELLVNGELIGNIPSGASRPDVASSFPTFPNAELSGFSMAFNYALLSPGSHQITVTAFDNEGASKSEAINFNVIGFHQQFFADSAAIVLDKATITGSGNQLFIQNMMVDGVAYDVTLTWDTESQTFQFSNIVASN